MKRLSKFFLATLLLTVTSVGWAACPEGYKNNYKGECVDASGKPLPKYLRKFDTGSGVLFGEEDDGSGTFRGFFYHGRNPHTPYAVAVVNAPDHLVRFGEQSIRFEIQPGDCGGSPGDSDCETDRERSELEGGKDQAGQEYWYAWSVYFKDYINIHPANSAHGQWKQYTKEWWNPYDQKMETQSHDVVMFPMRETGLKVSLSRDFDNERDYLLIPASEVSNQWHDLVLNIKWSPGSDGFVRIWRNGKLLVDHQGRNIQPKDPLSFRFGIYRSYIRRYKETFNVSETPPQVVYYDEVRRSKDCKGLMLDRLGYSCNSFK